MIAINRPTVAQLRAFLALAEHLHFREAAAALRLSQPGLSGAIATLEDTLGVQLVERTTRKVMLTPAGERVAHRPPPRHGGATRSRRRHRSRPGQESVS